MTPEQVYYCIEAVLGLPLYKQAVCVCLAAEASAPVWREWCERRGVEDHSRELLDCFERWLSDTATNEELDRAAKRLLETLPKDLREEDDPAPGYAGYALCDIALVGLGQCGEVHHSVVHTAVCYAAAAYCRIGIEAVGVDLNRLTAPELLFLDQWWQCCCEQFPELGGAIRPTS